MPGKLLVNHFVYREKERQAQKHRWIIRDKMMCLQLDQTLRNGKFEKRKKKC